MHSVSTGSCWRASYSSVSISGQTSISAHFLAGNSNHIRTADFQFVVLAQLIKLSQMFTGHLGSPLVGRLACLDYLPSVRLSWGLCQTQIRGLRVIGNCTCSLKCRLPRGLRRLVTRRVSEVFPCWHCGLVLKTYCHTKPSTRNAIRLRRLLPKHHRRRLRFADRPLSLFLRLHRSRARCSSNVQ